MTSTASPSFCAGSPSAGLGSLPDKGDPLETRILTALKTIDTLSDPDRRFLNGSVTSWPAIQRVAGHVIETDESAMERGRLSRFRPTRADIDDVLPALALLGPETKPWIWLLRMRAYGYSFRQVAMVRGRSGEYWRRQYRSVLNRIRQQADRRSKN